jgi:hypothetical protein
LVEVFTEGESRLGDEIIAPASAERVRNEIDVEAGTTTFVLIGKDGTEKLRKTEIDLDEIFEVIDAMPMRKREMKDKDQG